MMFTSFAATGDFNEMEAKLGLNWGRIDALLSFKGGLFEFGHHLATAKPAQIAALVLVAFVGRELGGECGIAPGVLAAVAAANVSSAAVRGTYRLS